MAEKATEILVCIDVDDMPKAEAFYVNGLGLRVGRHFDGQWLEILGASSPLNLLHKKAGTNPVPGNAVEQRKYSPHWSPVHLDFLIDDLDAAVLRATHAGATLEKPPSDQPYGRIAGLRDPFGHGFCLIQMNAQGYDAVLPKPG